MKLVFFLTGEADAASHPQQEIFHDQQSFDVFVA